LHSVQLGVAKEWLEKEQVVENLQLKVVMVLRVLSMNAMDAAKS
jgi:hypothetical protein